MWVFIVSGIEGKMLETRLGVQYEATLLVL